MDGIRHALVLKSNNGIPSLLSSGKGFPLFVRACCPPVIHTDMGNSPTLLVTADMDKNDADNWIDQNEESIIPVGFTSGQIVNEYEINGGKMYSGTITKKALDEKLVSFGDSFIVGSISVPLWNLSTLYASYIDGPFVIWKIGTSGSILGMVQGGKLQNICQLWPDTDDIEKDSEEVREAVEGSIRVLTEQRLSIPVVLYSSEPKWVIPEAFSFNDFKVIAPPVISGVPVIDHESFALACRKESALDFSPFEQVQQAKKMLSLRNTVYGISRYTIMLAFGALLLFGMFSGGEKVIERMNGNSFRSAHKQFDMLTTEKHKRDSLLQILQEKARFITDESIVTFLLNELQIVFPDGIAAEEINISEVGERTWRMDIRALSYSSSLIGPFLEKLGGVKGVSDVRMVYSEQTEQKKKKAIRFKTECIWEQ